MNDADLVNSMLGFSRLQRLRLRRHREPAPKMHGWPSAPSRAGEYNQLPPVADAEIRHEPEEAEIRGQRKRNDVPKTKRREGFLIASGFEKLDREEGQ